MLQDPEPHRYRLRPDFPVYFPLHFRKRCRRFRPGMNCKSQNEEKDVDADTVRRVKIVFTPGYKFKDMLDNVSIYKTEGNGGTSSGNGGGNKPENPDEGGSGEAPDPAA